MPALIPYPIVNGARASFSSVELNMNGLIFVGFKGVAYKRTRTRQKVYGNNPDPIGKTQGFNEYTGEAEVYIAEFNYFMVNTGVGWGDVFFNVYVTYTTNGFDTIQDTLISCTIDEVDANATQSPDPLVRKVVFNPNKILFNGIDDNATPLLSIAA
jgi:hypothetical protein